MEQKRKEFTQPSWPKQGTWEDSDWQWVDRLFGSLDEPSMDFAGISRFTAKMISDEIPSIAASGLHVLISGDTGTGKDLIARSIAKAAGYSTDQLICVNCAAISPSLIESELFGYVAGAFTGADAKEGKKGYFDNADGGAIFLDEIGEMPHNIQAKLLRVIEDGSFLPVGETMPKTVDVRLIAATNRFDRLREDIVWRFPERVHVPPLRERREDVFAILHWVLKKAYPDGSKEWLISPENMIAMLFSPWPGNVRELCNAAKISIQRHKHIWEEGHRWVGFGYDLPHEKGPELGDDKWLYEVWKHIAITVRRWRGGKRYIPVDYRPIGFDLYWARRLGLWINDPFKAGGMTLRQWVRTLIFSARNADMDELGNLDAALARCVREPKRLWQIPEGLIPKIPVPPEEDSAWHKSHEMLATFKHGDLEREYFTALREKHPTQMAAAKAAGMAITSFKGKLDKYGIPNYGRPKPRN